MHLSRRRRLILKAVVEEHVRSGQPVGSGQLVRRYGLAVSPATVRNELAWLEDGGYVTQPHTSAGRTPSDLGYRFYVDYLMPSPESIPPQEELVRRYLAACGRDVRDAVRATARFLADITSYVALVLAPDQAPGRIQQVHLLPLAKDQVLMVVVLDGDFVQHRLIDLGGKIDRADLELLGRELQAALAGCTAEDLPEAVNQLWRSSLARYGALLESATEALVEALGRDQVTGERLYLGGTANVLDLPEFQSVERLRGILNLLEGEASVSGLLEERAQRQGVSVTIGDENAAAEIKSCSLVTATYRAAGGGLGIIGLLGPTRMDYGRVMALLGLASRQLDDIFGD